MFKDGFWVFGYGSLIWKPGFDFEEKSLARLTGFRRAFCMVSVHYRGTVDLPGLVLALDVDQDASCDGVAYFIPAVTARITIDYLRERELIASAYVEHIQQVTLTDGRKVDAVCYVVDRGHEQYAGGLSLSDQADIIAVAQGSTGLNIDYLTSTTEHLEQLGIADPELQELENLVKNRP